MNDYLRNIAVWGLEKAIVGLGEMESLTVLSTVDVAVVVRRVGVECGETQSVFQGLQDWTERWTFGSHVFLRKWKKGICIDVVPASTNTRGILISASDHHLTRPGSAPGSHPQLLQRHPNRPLAQQTVISSGPLLRSAGVWGSSSTRHECEDAG
jgi:hypothetical protein